MHNAYVYAHVGRRVCMMYVCKRASARQPGLCSGLCFSWWAGALVSVRRVVEQTSEGASVSVRRVVEQTSEDASVSVRRVVE